MGVARKWIFPILRIIIFAAIAAALVKIAFFPEVTQVLDPAVPTGEIVEPQVPITVGTIPNDVTLAGTVAADPAVSIKATLAGQVRKVLVAQGQWVEAGTEILTLRAELTNPDGTVSVKNGTVVSPAAGTLATFSALVGQSFSVGDDVGTVAPPTFNVSGTLAPEQQYRLLTQPTEAQVTITGGPAPFTCPGLTITTAVATSAGEGGTTTVRCNVPPEVRVFSGLAAQLVLAGGIAENVLTAPLTAVEGSAGTGNVHLVLPDGTTEVRPVTLGISDGVNVEIVGGVEEGDLVLQFLPGAPGDPGGGFPGEFPTEGDCKPTPDGGMVCSG